MNTTSKPSPVPFLVLAVVGTVVPWIFFGRYLAGGGTLLGFLPAALANDVSRGLVGDLLLSCLVFWIWAFGDARRRGAGAPWLSVVLTLAIGLSCALPHYLWTRARTETR